MTSEQGSSVSCPDKRTASDYFDAISSLFRTVYCDYNKESLPLDAATRAIAARLQSMRSSHKVMLVGNGGSAAIAAHIVADLSNRVQVKAQTFQNPPVLTALSNDHGYESAYEAMIKLWAEPDDMLIAISSSGQSENIVRAAEAARARSCTVVTMSGFSADNALRSRGDFNFYVPSNDYGEVEIVHHALANYLVEAAAPILPEGRHR